MHSAKAEKLNSTLSALAALASTAVITASGRQPDPASLPDPLASNPWTLSDREAGLTPPLSAAVARGELTEAPFVRMDSEGRSLNRIWTQHWERHDVIENSSVTQPFGDADLSGFGKRGLVVVKRRAWTGEGDAVVRASEIDFGGDTIFTATVPYEPVPLTAERFDSLVNAWTAGGSVGAGVREAIYRPAYLPAVRRFVAAEDGTVWLQRFDPVVLENGESVHEWWVLDGGGIPVARALTPVDLELKLIADDAVWSLERDELDVEYIVRHRLTKDG